jgi:hypothetical protein
MKKDKIQTKCVNSAFVDTAVYDIMARNNDFIEVTEWHNQEGYLIHLCKQQTSGDYEDKYINFTIGEFEAIKTLIKQLHL